MLLKHDLHVRMQQMEDLRTEINNIQTQSKLNGVELHKEVMPLLRMTLHLAS